MRWNHAVVLMIVLLFILPVFAHSMAAVEDKPLVVASTSVLASIVRDLAGDQARVVYLVSPSMCPGHYDVKPGDLETFRNADLVLYHGFEPWVKELVKAVNATGDWKGAVARVSGPWNTPDALKKLYTNVAEALKEKLGIQVNDRLKECISSIDKVASELKKIASENEFEGTPVVCMLWQKPFVSYMGFKIVAVYGPPEKLSVKDIESIEKNATKNHAALVIDNLQSGVEVGERIARDVGAVHVVLVNFPDSVAGVHNVTEMMLYNAKLLENAMHSHKYIIEANTLKDKLETWRAVALGAIVIAIVEALVLAVQALRKR